MASKEFCRPNPENLLRQIQAQEEHESRGRLKVFLGYAPRVGKSLRMFDEGRRRLQRGQDVVVGALQPRGAGDLAHVLGEFEIIPASGGAVNVEAILARRPEVCLIDELAKDNPPGAPRTHRWQDVEELRSHGINVVGAINLQHICEAQQAVERITGRRALNSVPESFVLSADEIVIVDVPQDELKPSDGHPVQFTAGQLSELRELALLTAAQVVETQLQRYMDVHGIQQSWGTQERILICMTSRSSARDMVASAARAASRFHAQLMAISVQQHEPTRAEEEALQENLAHAKKLGAEIHVVQGKDPIQEIVRFAREHRVTQIFIGHTQQSSWKFWAKNHVETLIDAAEGMDVRIFPSTPAPSTPAPSTPTPSATQVA